MEGGWAGRHPMANSGPGETVVWATGRLARHGWVVGRQSWWAGGGHLCACCAVFYLPATEKALHLALISSLSSTNMPLLLGRKRPLPTRGSLTAVGFPHFLSPAACLQERAPATHCGTWHGRQGHLPGERWKTAGNGSLCFLAFLCPSKDRRKADITP